MQNEQRAEGQLCLKVLLAAELFSRLTEEEQDRIISQIEFLLSRE